MIAAPFLVALAAAVASPTPCIERDDRGNAFRTCFDPGNALLFGAGVSGRSSTPTLAITPVIEAAILLRTQRASVSKGGSLWFNEHRLFAVRMQPDATQLEIDATAYHGTYRRHIPEGFILLPSQPPQRLPFPFDLAIDLDVGRVEWRPWSVQGVAIETARAALLLDPVRSTTRSAFFAFGPALAHGMRIDGIGNVVQEVTPFTAMALELGLESSDGWWALRGSGLGGWTLVPGQSFFPRARGEMRLERVLVSINDQPLHAVLSASGAYNDAGPKRATEFAITFGIAMRVFRR